MKTKAKSQKKWAVVPYNISRLDEKILISNLFGAWDILGREDFKQLETLQIEERSPLFKRLLTAGLIVRDDTLPEQLNHFRNLNNHIYSDASLHIVVVTTRCNLDCRYCQTRSDDGRDMNFDVAARVLKFIFDTQNKYANIEFQGGEPLLNWDVIKFVTDNAGRINAGNKNLNISLVTNGVLLDTEKLDYLVRNDVGLCFSLDGPSDIHDKNRKSAACAGTHAAVKKSVEDAKRAYRENGINKRINLLCTITRHSLDKPEAIIGEYAAMGADRIALRPLSPLGMAKEQWEDVGYAPEEFNRFWARALDHILELNRKGIRMQERLATVLLSKIIDRKNPGYVDMMSPCGAGRAVLAYMPNGDVYPCDEARMLKEDIFKLGNVTKDTYEDIMKSDNVFCLCQASLMDLWHYNSAFLPWLGTCPVLNYARDGNLVPKITETPLFKNFSFQIRYIFDKIVSGGPDKDILLSWKA